MEITVARFTRRASGTAVFKINTTTHKYAINEARTDYLLMKWPNDDIHESLYENFPDVLAILQFIFADLKNTPE